MSYSHAPTSSQDTPTSENKETQQVSSVEKKKHKKKVRERWGRVMREKDRRGAREREREYLRKPEIVRVPGKRTQRERVPEGARDSESA